MPSVPFQQAIIAAAAKWGIPEPIALGLIKQESGFNPNAHSPAGAQGLTQIMPGKPGVTNPYDVQQNLNAGFRELKSDYDAFHTWNLALAAYNAGPGAVRKYGGIPPYAETQHYVPTVLGFAKRYAAQGFGQITPAGPAARAGMPATPTTSSNTIASTTPTSTATPGLPTLPALPGPNMQFIQGILDQNAKIAHITAPQLPINMPSLQSTLPPGPSMTPPHSAPTPSGTGTPPPLGTPADVPGSQVSSVYANPYRGLQGGKALGRDHGYDWGGAGPIYAIGPGVVRIVNNHSGWQGGHAIAIELTAGPQKGKWYYLAENIVPQVKPGQHVNANTVIATTTNAYPYTESGWAIPGTDTYFPAPRNASPYGAAFEAFLRSLGVRV